MLRTSGGLFWIEIYRSAAHAAKEISALFARTALLTRAFNRAQRDNDEGERAGGRLHLP